ncbi:MAG: hypothetical protein K0Q79_752 [Flavipsychrobacter sp.]|jgi:hypothetical protein|nr:hypothetical protein [Flavipsychrobacter sp.]
MNRYLVISLLFLAACNNSETGHKGNIPVELVSNPHTAAGLDTVAAERKPTMSFKDTLHDFGTLHEGERVEYDFEFTNNGKSPLLITSASGSCGCTVADYPKDPLEPGKSASMKVTFNSAGKHGTQEKAVTVHTNSLQSVHMLYIKAYVEPKK